MHVYSASPAGRNRALGQRWHFSQAKSAPTVGSIAKLISGLVRFYIENRGEIQLHLAGPEKVTPIRDYLELAAERGRTDLSTVKHAQNLRAEAIGIERLLPNPRVASAAVVEATDAPSQAPAMAITTVRALEEMARNGRETPYKRAFAAGILRMTYAIARFSDAQPLRPFEINRDSVRGALIARTSRKAHGEFRPCASPGGGGTGSRGRARPLFGMRLA